MGIKKTLLAFAAMALATGAFASAAMAEDGELYDVNGTPVAAGTLLHFEGTTEFNTLGTGIHCSEVTATVEMHSASTGTLIALEPTIETCEGFGFIDAGCTVESAETTLEESHVTVTPTDIDVTGFTEMFWTHNAECATPTTTLEFEEEITVRPINEAGETIGAEEPIYGIEFETEGRATNSFGTFAIAMNANLPATPEQQGTYEIR